MEEQIIGIGLGVFLVVGSVVWGAGTRIGSLSIDKLAELLELLGQHLGERFKW